MLCYLHKSKMSDYVVCIACLSSESRLINLKQTPLCEVYEKLSNTSLHIDRMPDSLCYICYSQLKRCHRFICMCQKAGKKLTQLLANGIQLSEETVSPLDQRDYNSRENVLGPTSIILFDNDNTEETQSLKQEIVEVSLINNSHTCTEGTPVKSIKPEPEELPETTKLRHTKNEFIEIKIEDVTEELEEACNENDFIPMDIEPTVEIHVGESEIDASDCSSHQTETSDSKESNYACNICDLKFACKATLTRHTRVHSGKKPFPCHHCDKAYFTKGVLKRHLLVHTGERPFPCPNCDKTFSQSGHLVQHMRIHTGEKPHVCEKCKKPFHRRGELNRHMLIHAEEYPSSCTFCNKKFTSLNKYKKHMTAHTVATP